MALLGEGFTPNPADISRALATKSDRMHWFDRRPEAAIFDGAFNVPMLWNSNFFMTPETMKILRLLIDVGCPISSSAPAAAP